MEFFFAQNKKPVKSNHYSIKDLRYVYLKGIDEISSLVLEQY